MSISQSLKSIWMQPKESTVLAVWEPAAQSLKLATTLLFGNTRLAHMYVSIVLFAISTGILVVLLDDHKEAKEDDATTSTTSTTSTSNQKSTSKTIQFLSVMLFAMSPVRVELIAWVSCQSYVLALFFSILFIYSWRSYQSSVMTTHLTHFYFFMTLLFYTMACMSKAAALPVFLYIVVNEYKSNDTFKSVVANITVMMICLGTIAVCCGYCHMSANQGLKESSNEISFDIVFKAFTSTIHYFFNLFLPRSCVHFFYNNNNNTTSTTTTATHLQSNDEQSLQCILWDQPITIITFTGMLSLLFIAASHWHVPVTTMMEDGTSTLTLNHWQFLKFLKTKRCLYACSLLVCFILFASPGIVASSFGLHGSDQGGAAHDRYSFLSEALIGIPLMTCLLTWMQKKCGTLSLCTIVCIVIAHRTNQTSDTYKRWIDTKSLWNDALLQNPNDVHALLSLGEVYSLGCTGTKGAKGCGQALHFMKQALELDQHKANGWFNYGITLYKANLQQEALDAMQQAHALDSYDTVTMERILLLASETQDVTTLLFICNKMKQARCWSILGGMLHSKKEIEKAIDSYKKAILIDDSMNDLVHNMGIGYFQLGKFQQASEVLKNGIVRYPNDIEMKKTWKMIKEKMRKIKS
jgi:Tfp pilus assembly protein PilF